MNIQGCRPVNYVYKPDITAIIVCFFAFYIESFHLDNDFQCLDRPPIGFLK